MRISETKGVSFAGLQRLSSSAASHKIVKADAILVSIPFESGGVPPWSFGGAPKLQFDTLLVRLETEQGIVGWGEAFSRCEDKSLKAMIETRVLPLVIGRSALEIGKIKYDVEFRLQNFGRVGPIIYGVSAVDIALWDILGKISGLPLTALLGGAFASEVEVYASLMRYGNCADVVRVTRQAIERGYRYIKLHEITADEIHAAVEAAGAQAAVMLDTNCPWPVAEALKYDRLLEPLNLYWLEEPVWPPENYAGLARIRSTGRHHIAAGENAGSLHDFVAMIAAGAIDIAQPDVAKAGGISELVKIASLCQAESIEFVPHCAIFGPGQVATIHLNAAQRSVPMLERLYCDFEAEIYGGATLPVNGKVAVPTGPGLGLDPDPGVINRYRVA
ncbi:mandelate racemase/muconate lactonizing enzyme family protein [Bradyrhizobium sp. NBAIM03]|uniref:mandelate racemase/muconate lactonizing enzyme family protein n=1 Tax=Bradyrhizobium sp. NBAIM03 TaxID=2793816 RepID=UPI001CD40206|nr:mandelate racemase/muconate lactonizing enzyme family protein [Bradyrhizobium sp. NBAIM03]MCA1537688.1 mandelate racemase/muconate lactonizing enzyme family protein [Bradyrhizobium sp. NBAIM03]